MPAYLVALPDVPGLTLPEGGKNKAIIFAADATDARMIYKDYMNSAALDALIADGSTTVTAIVGATDFQGWALHLTVNHPTTDALVAEASATGQLGGFSAVITAAGTGYSAGDILTPSGGTSARAMTFRVVTVSTGAVATIELVDAGEYTVAPSGARSTTVAPSGGTGCTLTITMGTYNLANILAHAVSLLNADAQIAASAVDSGNDTGQLLTVAGTADSLGDHIVNYTFSGPGDQPVNHAAAVAAVVDEGSGGAALTIRFATSASTTIPKVIGLYL